MNSLNGENDLAIGSVDEGSSRLESGFDEIINTPEDLNDDGFDDLAISSDSGGNVGYLVFRLT